MAAARSHAPGDEVALAVQVDEAHIVSLAAGAAQHVAVSALERGARQHDHRIGLPCALDLGAQCLQPAAPVFVIERNPGRHLRHVFGRVEAVALDEGRTERLRQPHADLALAAGADAHHYPRGPFVHALSWPWFIGEWRRSAWDARRCAGRYGDWRSLP